MPESAPREKASSTRSQRQSAPERGERTGHERTIGNRSMGALLTLGAPNDAAEARADAAADGVMQRLAGHAVAAPVVGARAATGMIRRAGGRGAATVSPQQSSRLAAAKRGGEPIASGARGELERGFGRSLSSMRIHDGPEAHGLARSFGARAFSVDNHLFFGAGQYQPHTKFGKRLLSHEIAHGLEGEAGVVRRLTYEATPDKYYSDALLGQAVDAASGVATVTGSSSVFHGGHAFIYLEYLDRDANSGALTPRTRKLELTAGGAQFSGTRSGSGSGSKSGHASAGSSAHTQDHSSGSSGSGSGSTETLHIAIGEAESSDLKYLRRAGRRKSWVTTRDAMDRILAKARDVRTNIDKYTYKLTGRSLFARKKTVNCARFAEKILKAGGIAASAGTLLKTTATLTSGRDVGFTKDTDWDAVTTARDAAEVLRRQRAEQQRLADEQAAAQALALAQAQQQRLDELGIDRDDKYTVTWNPTVGTVRGHRTNSDKTLVQYTLVDGEPTAPGQIRRGQVAFADGLTKNNTARIYGTVIFTDGDRRNQIEVHLGDALAAITSAT